MAVRAAFEEAIRLAFELEGQGEAKQAEQLIRLLGAASEQAAEQASGLLDELANTRKLKDAADAYRASAVQVRDLAKQLTEAQGKTKAYAAEVNAADAPTKKQVAELEKQRKSLSDLSGKLETARTTMRGYGETLKTAGVSTTSFAQAQAEIAKRSTAAATGVRDIATATTAAKREQEALNLRVADASEKLRRMSEANRVGADALRKYRDNAKDAATATTQLGNSGEKLRGMELSLGKIAGAAGVAAIAIKGISIAKDAFGGTLEIQKGLSQVAAVASATREEFAALRESAESESARTGVALDEVINGLTELARAGLSAQESMAALPAVLAVSQSAGVGVAEATTIVTTTLTQFGLAASEAGRVADVLAQAANSTQSSVQGLGLSLGYAAPLARQLGLNLEQTTAVIAALADQGFRGERSGTALRNVFSALLDPSSKFREELDRLGIKSNDFTEILGQLAAKGEEGKNALLALDSEARPAIASLFASGGESIRKLITNLDGASGAAERTASIMRDNVSTAAAQLGNRLKIAFGDLIEPLLKPLQGELEALAEQITSFASSPEFAEIRTALGEMFVEGLEAAREFVAKVDFVEVLADVQEFAVEATKSLKEFGDNAGATLTVLSKSIDALQLVFNGAQIVFEAIAVVVAKLAGNVVKFQLGLAQMSLELAELRGNAEDVAAITAQIEGLKGALAAIEETADGFGNALVSNSRDARDALKSLVGVQDDATEASRRLAAASESVGPAIASVEPAAVHHARVVRELAAAADEATVAQTAAASASASLGPTTSTAAAQAREALLSVGVAGTQASAATIAAWELARTELIAKAKDIAIEMSNALRNGAAQDVVQPLKDQYNEVSKQVNDLTTAITKQKAAATETATQSTTGYTAVATAARSAAAAAADVGDAAKTSSTQTAGAAEGIVGVLKALNEHYAAVSENARQYFVEAYNSSVRAAIGLKGVGEAIERADAATRDAIAGQRTNAEQLVGVLERTGIAGTNAGYATAEAAEAAARALEGSAAAARAGRTAIGLLDQATLDRVASAAQAAADRVREIQRAAQDARAELVQLGDSLQDELDRDAGNEEAVAIRNHQRRLAEIRELAATAGAAGAAEARRATELADRQHAAEVARIRAQREEEQQSHEERLRQSREEANASEPTAPAPTRPRNTASSAAGEGGSAGGIGDTRTLRVEFGDLGTGIDLAGDQVTEQKVRQIINTLLQTEVPRLILQALRQARLTT